MNIYLTKNTSSSEYCTQMVQTCNNKQLNVTTLCMGSQKIFGLGLCYMHLYKVAQRFAYPFFVKFAVFD